MSQNESQAKPAQIIDLQASGVHLFLHADGSIDLRQPWACGNRMKVLVHPDNAQQALWAALALRRAADHLQASFPALEG